MNDQANNGRETPNLLSRVVVRLYNALPPADRLGARYTEKGYPSQLTKYDQSGRIEGAKDFTVYSIPCCKYPRGLWEATLI